MKGAERQRAIRTSQMQYKVYVHFLEQFPELICDNKDSTLPEDHFAKKWKDLTNRLNASGAQRTTEEWQVVFKNWKHSTRHKARKIAEELKNGGLNKMSPLLNVEIRALKLWGGVLIDGNQVDVFGLADDVEEEELKFVPALKNDIEDFDVVFDVLPTTSKKTGDESKHERQRAIRTSTLQHTIYVEFLEEFPEMICEKKDPLLPEDYFAKKWEALADMLNSCKKGPKKSANEWINTFKNWKHCTRHKARKIAEDDDNGKLFLIDLEQRALKLWDSGNIEKKTSSVASSAFLEELDIDFASSSDNDTQTCAEFNILSGPENKKIEINTDETKSERQRAIRTSAFQHNIYVEFLEEFPEMIWEKKDPLLPEDYFAKKWEALADMLNSCEKGPKKSAHEWQHTFKNWKHCTRHKARKVAEEGHNSKLYLMDLEERALKLWDRAVTVENNVINPPSLVDMEEFDLEFVSASGNNTQAYDLEFDIQPPQKKRKTDTSAMEFKIFKFLEDKEKAQAETSQKIANSIDNLSNTVAKMAEAILSLANSTAAMVGHCSNCKQ